MVLFGDANLDISSQDIARLVENGGENGMITALVLVIVLSMCCFFAFICVTRWLEGKKHNHQIIDLLHDTSKERSELVRSQFELKDSIDDMGKSMANGFADVSASVRGIAEKVEEHEERITDIEREIK